MTRTACYPGSFDPVTFGHLDLIERAVRLFDRLVVAVGINASKTPLFSLEERTSLLRAELADRGLSVEVTAFEGLIVDHCHALGASVIIRGLRTVSDFENEFQMGLTNRCFAPEIETVFVMPGERYGFVSSRLIKEIVRAGGATDRFVPARVARALEEKLR